MDNAELRNTIETVVRAVLAAMGVQVQAIGSAPPVATTSSDGEALALFTGGRVHLDEVVSGFQRIGRAGFRVDGILSSGAGWVLGEQSAESLGLFRLVNADRPSSYEALVRPYKAIILPTLSRTTGAKLVWGICDTMATNAVYSALALDLPVIALRDSMAGEDEEECRECGNSLPYVRTLNAEYFERLEKLGIRVIEAKELAEELLAVLRGGRPAISAYRGLVTEEDVKNLRHGEIRIAPGTLITPLAQDHLNEHGIRVRVVQENPERNSRD